MKYSAKDREMAAVILSICACQADWRLGIGHAALLIDAGLVATDLASQAWAPAATSFGATDHHVLYAEAEALIRTGWSP